MTSDAMPPEFPLPRVPSEDWNLEEQRRSNYWAWLEKNSGRVRDGSKKIATLADGWSWASLTGPSDADYEARAMKHSIGFNFGHYSRIGELLSLRDLNNVPQATILAQTLPNGSVVVVHAREHENTRLSPANEARLADFASTLGWRVQPESLPFDVYEDDGANTALKYLHRAPDGRKTTATVVMAGRTTPSQTYMVAMSLRDGRYFAPSEFGLLNLRHGGTTQPCDHEIVCISHVASAPTIKTTTAKFLQKWADIYLDLLEAQKSPAP